MTHVAIIWQRFLPYHIARIKHLCGKLSPPGYRLSAIEVASQDDSYGFPEIKIDRDGFEYIRCFPGMSYHQLQAKEIHKKVFSVLRSLNPDIVFAPATAFPEGMASGLPVIVSQGCGAAKTQVKEGENGWQSKFPFGPMRGLSPA